MGCCGARNIALCVCAPVRVYAQACTGKCECGSRPGEQELPGHLQGGGCRVGQDRVPSQAQSGAEPWPKPHSKSVAEPSEETPPGPSTPRRPPQNVKPQRPTGLQGVNLSSPRTSFITVSPGRGFALFWVVLVLSLHNSLQCMEKLILYLLCVIIRLRHIPRQLLIPARSALAPRPWELTAQPVCPVGPPAVWGSPDPSPPHLQQRGRS